MKWNKTNLISTNNQFPTTNQQKNDDKEEERQLGDIKREEIKYKYLVAKRQNKEIKDMIEICKGRIEVLK